MGFLSKIAESIGDWLWITSRTLGIRKCDDHGWTYLIDDTESDLIECPFCRAYRSGGSIRI